MYAGKHLVEIVKILKHSSVHSKSRKLTSGLINQKSFSTNNKKSSDNCVKNLNEENNVATGLINWAMKNNISFHAFSQLLNILSEHGIQNLPKNAKELLQAREDGIKETLVPPGTYIHFGLEKNIRRVISALLELKVLHQTDIQISIFIDNLPLSSVTQQGLWTILGSIVGFNNIIFLIGAYQGYAKPNNSNLFLNEFVNEAKDLCMNGLNLNKVNYKVAVKRIICDAPAKVFSLNIKNYMGYSSCTKCQAVGEYKNKKICFPDKSTPRTDKDFESDDIYQGEKTKLLEIPNFGVVTNIPLDYFHLVCLGVVKKLVSIWLSKDIYWISKNNCEKLFKMLPALKPSEFQVKPKPLSLSLRWTSFEFRQFLLYHGPVVLRNSLDEKYYNHFLSLHVACRLFCVEDNQKFIKFADNLLSNFVSDFGKFFGKQHISHNIHGLYHLSDDYRHHGTLDSFSAFPFERFLVQLRNSMKKLKRKPLPKMILRQSYENVFTKNLKALSIEEFSVSKKLKEPCNNHPEDFKSFSQYESLIFENTEITPSKNADRYVCLKNGKVIEVTSVLGKKQKSSTVCFIGGKEFSSISNFYTEPLESSQLNVFKVCDLSDVVNYWPVSFINKKCMKIPFENSFIMVGLLDEDF